MRTFLPLFLYDLKRSVWNDQSWVPCISTELLFSFLLGLRCPQQNHRNIGSPQENDCGTYAEAYAELAYYSCRFK